MKTMSQRRSVTRDASRVTKKKSGGKLSEFEVQAKLFIAAMLTLMAGWGLYVAMYAAFVAFGGE